MGKFQDLSVIQILREITFGESRSFTNAVYMIFAALNFDNLAESGKNHKNQNSEPLNVEKADFAP